MIWSSYLAQSRGERVWGRRFLSKFSTIVLGLLVVALVTTGLAAAAPLSTNLDSSAMLGNEAEDAIAVNPTNTSNVVTMSTLPDVVSGLSVNVTRNGGQTWARRVIGGTISDPLGDICCDQQLAWDRFGNLWMTYLVNENFHVLLALSTDGGMSFTKVAEIAPGGDQPSIAVGANSVWVSYATSPGKQIHAFGAPVTGLGQFGSFTTPEDVPNPGGNGDYGDTAVGPNGQVMVTYQKNESGKGGTDIFTALDPDGLGPAGTP